MTGDEECGKGAAPGQRMSRSSLDDPLMPAEKKGWKWGGQTLEKIESIT